MNNITEHIRNRRSVRTYDGRELDKIELITSKAVLITTPITDNIIFLLLLILPPHMASR